MGIDKVDPLNPGGRPIPDKPRDRDDNSKIYALLVGVDDYQGEIPALGGCLADIDAVANYLRSEYGQDADGNTLESVLSPLDADRENEDIQIESVGRLHICSLKDEAATYSNVIRAFREFLVNDNATADASYWFHFSGHGTERFTAREFYRPEKGGVKFPALEPNGKDQCLVLYNANGGLDGALLADKELAVLIDDVYSSARSINENHKPHIVVSIDCCHAGTATRGEDDPFNVRAIKNETVQSRDWEDAEDGGIPNIADYLDGHYSRLMGEEDERSPANLFIPQAPHMLIAGAHALEKAGDTLDGGFFTKSLIEVLSKPDVGFNYVDLFNQTRNKVRKLNTKQTPQFESINSFNPYTRFLEGWEDEGNVGLYPVRTNKGGTSWFVRCGAVNGLPVDSDEEIQVIIRHADTKVALGNAFITSVGVQDSRMELGFALVEQPAVVGNPNKILDPALLPNQDGISDGIPSLELDNSGDTPYVAQLYKLPADDFFVKDLAGLRAKIAAEVLEEERPDLEAYLTELENFNIHIATDESDTATAALEVSEVPGGFLIKDLQGEIDDYKVAGNAHIHKKIDKVLASILKIVRWKRMLGLENPATQLKDFFSAELEMADQSLTTINRATFTSMPFGSLELIKPEDEFLSISFFDEDLEEDITKHYLRIRLKLNFANKLNTENLYFYLFNLKENAAIESEGLGELRIENTGLLPGDKINYQYRTEDQLGPDDHPSQVFETELVMPEEGNKEVWFFKLLVTKRQIDVEPLLQTDLDGDRGNTGLNRTSGLKNDWCFMTMKLAIEKI